MKKQDLDKASEKQRRETDALIANPDFQADVASLRKKWNIPTGGFTTGEDTQSWQHWLSEQTDNRYGSEWPKYRELLLKLKEAGNPLEYKKENKRINKLAPINAWREDIGAILRKYQLRPSLKDGIKGYILTNHLGGWLGVIIRAEEDELTGFTELHLIIDENTTLEDIKAMWSVVNFHQSKLQYKKKSRRKQPQQKRDQLAYELFVVQKRSMEKVQDALYRKSGDIYGPEDIHNFIRRYKEKTGIK